MTSRDEPDARRGGDSGFLTRRPRRPRRTPRPPRHSAESPSEVAATEAARVALGANGTGTEFRTFGTSAKGWITDVGVVRSPWHGSYMKQRLQVAAIIVLTLTCIALVLWGHRNRRDAEVAEKQRALADHQLTLLQHAGLSEHGCHERGGEISHRPFGSTFCKVTYADAGLACTDVKDCLGGCVLPNAGDYPREASGLKGVCKTANVQGGCTTYLVGGRIEWTDCID